MPGLIPEEAITWLERAAFKGHVRAQYALGLCHAKAVAVKRDLVQAHVWISLAGEAGFPKALHKLPLLEEEMSTQMLLDARRRLPALRRAINDASR
jgi:TPR repeat protein